MAAYQTPQDDLNWFSKIDASQNHGADEEGTFSDFIKEWWGNSSERLCRAICRDLVCVALVRHMSYEDAQAVLDYARSQRHSPAVDLQMRQLIVIAAARFAAIEIERGHGHPHMLGWAEWYYDRATPATQNQPEIKSAPSPLRTVLEKHMGLLALLANDPGRAELFSKRAVDSARFIQPMPDVNTTDEYRELMWQQLDQALQLQDLVTAYPNTDGRIGNTGRTWQQTMRELLGNPDMPDETSRQS